MSTVLALLLLAIALGILYLFYREYRRSRVRRDPQYTEALMDLLDGRPDAAYAKFKEAVSHNSDNVDAYLRLAGLLAARGEHDRASRIFQMLSVRRNLAPRDEQKVALAIAREHLRAKRVNRAISVLEQMNERDPKDIAGRELLFFVHVANDRASDAKDVLKELLRLQKDKRRAAFYCTELGARILAKEPDAAQDYFRQALQLDSNSVPGLIYTGDALHAQGKMDEAVETWKRVLAHQPELSFLVRERLERAFYETGHYEEIVKVYEELLGKMPDDTGLHVALARIYAKKGDTEKARATLSRIPAARQKDPLVHLVNAQLRLDQGDAGAARTELARAEEQLRHERLRCRQCGFVAEQELTWRCPNCGAWESFKTERRA